MLQYQISSKPRHLRYMYFIESDYSYEKLIKLIHHNQGMWGGRYNPIIPFKDGLIVEGYLNIIKHYDPDYIFYSDGINPAVIQKLRFFNPIGYFNLDKEGQKEDILGVNSMYLISRIEQKFNVLSPRNLWKTNSPLLEYYKTNFGLASDAIMSDYEITKNLNQIKITDENFSELHQIIHEQKPINQANLSKKNLNTKILRNLTHAKYNSFELIISRDRTSILDLLYFWNRQLFQCRNLIYLTLAELLILTHDKYFGGVLYDLSSEPYIDVVSLSLTKQEVEDLISKHINKIAFHKRFLYKEVIKFPFEVLDGNGLFEREYGEQTSIQTLISKDNILFTPKLSFTDKVEFYPQKWATDIQIKVLGENNQGLWNFPSTTDSSFIIKQVSGRINKQRDITYFIHNQMNTSGSVNIEIPEFSNLLKQLIKNPVVHGIRKSTKWVDIGPHDSSNKLKSFIRTFGFDFNTIHGYFTDKFWVDTFETLCTSEKSAGDSISFHELLNNCSAIFETNGSPLGKREETYRNLENLSLGLQEKIRELCDLNVLLQGFKLKCPHCSTIAWYHIKEANRKINCKGCMEDFNMAVEPKFHYKLNDLIKNNIFQSKTQRDGNLTVIRTLISLTKRGHYSFKYSPQINLYDSHHIKKPSNELDIIALVNGRLILGEAKHNSNEFSANSYKSINSLIEVCKEIFPDKVILSCYKDEHSRLDKAKTHLEYHFKHWDYAPEIEVLLLDEPDYFELGGSSYFYY